MPVSGITKGTYRPRDVTLVQPIAAPTDPQQNVPKTQPVTTPTEDGREDYSGGWENIYDFWEANFKDKFPDFNSWSSGQFQQYQSWLIGQGTYNEEQIRQYGQDIGMFQQWLQGNYGNIGNPPPPPPGSSADPIKKLWEEKFKGGNDNFDAWYDQHYRDFKRWFDTSPHAQELFGDNPNAVNDPNVFIQWMSGEFPDSYGTEPGWMKDYRETLEKQYEPKILKSEDYTLSDKQLEGLEKTAQTGYGQQWMRSMYEGALTPATEQYSQTIGGLRDIASRSGFGESGIVESAMERARAGLGSQALSTLGGVREQNEAQRLSAQGTLGQAEIYNKTVEEAIADWNRRQVLAEDVFKMSKEQAEAQRKAYEALGQKSEFGADIGASLQLGLAGLGALGPWGLMAAGLPWLDDIFGG